MKPLTEFRNLFIKDISMIPYFIDTKLPAHRQIWANLQSIIKVLSRLSNETILTEKQIKNYANQTEELINYILDDSGTYDILEIELSWYILQLLEQYEEKALELELYEQCENIKRYKKIYLFNE